MKNIKRYEQMKNKLKSVRARPVRPSSGFSERDRLYDRDLFLAMKLQQEEYEEGEIRKEDWRPKEKLNCNVICLDLGRSR